MVATTAARCVLCLSARLWVYTLTGWVAARMSTSSATSSSWSSPRMSALG